MLQEFNTVMDYIDNHLTDDIAGKDIERIAGVSEYHFRRMFSYMSGMSLNEYIRNRRLAYANQQLLSNVSVSEIAFMIGYNSVDGFSRAFKEWSGYRPSNISTNKIQKSFPKLTFHLNLKGGTSMEFKIEKKEKFNLVGVTKVVPIQFEGENNEINMLAQSITKQQREELHQLKDVYPNQVLNASYNFDKGRLLEEGNLTHLIGVATTQENPYSDLEQIPVSENLWAVFPNKGPFPNTLQETWANIYSQWLPSSNYELVDAPEISFTQFTSDSTQLYSEIWIAVKLRQ